jgi:RHS repeat-associated protein
LSDVNGLSSDSYAYDANGVLLASSGTSSARYLFRAEQRDEELSAYYLRARYYAQSVGRFTALDQDTGVASEPSSLHKYLYGNADPVNNVDPSGRFALLEFLANTFIRSIIAGFRIVQVFRALTTARQVAVTVGALLYGALNALNLQARILRFTPTLSTERQGWAIFTAFLVGFAAFFIGQSIAFGQPHLGLPLTNILITLGNQAIFQLFGIFSPDPGKDIVVFLLSFFFGTILAGAIGAAVRELGLTAAQNQDITGFAEFARTAGVSLGVQIAKTVSSLFGIIFEKFPSLP